VDPEPTSRADSGVVDVLLARIDEIEARLQATTAAIDEKSLKEFRKTVEAISKRDPKFEERVTDRVDVIADRIETVARTVSTTSAALAAKDGEIAQLHRELEATSTRFSAAVADARQGSNGAELAEIRRTIADLSKQKLPRGLEGRIEELAAKVGLLAQRVDTVSSTVSTTAAGLSGRDGDVTSLRRAHEADVERIGAELAGLRQVVDASPVAELQQTVKQVRDETGAQRLSYQRWFKQATGSINGLAGGLGELRESVESLSERAAAREQAEADAARVLTDQISAVGERTDDLGSRLDSLIETVATTSSRFETRNEELDAMEQRFGETTSRVDGLVGELMRAVDESPDPRSLEAGLNARIDELSDRFVKLGEQLDRADATMPERLREATSAVEELERTLVEQRGLVESLAARLEESSASTEEWISGSRDELAALRAFVEDGGTRLTTAVGELSSSVATVSAQVAVLEHADGDAVKTLDERISSVAQTVDELAAHLESTLARVTGGEEELAAVRAFVETGGTRLGSHISDLKQHVSTLRDQLAGLERADGDVSDRVSDLGTSMHELDGRLSEASDALAALSQRSDALATNVESAVVSLSDKQGELTEIRRHFAESSTRIETVVEDIRDALGALPDASPEAFEGLTSKLESMAAGMTSLAGRLERLEAVHVDQVAAELTERFDRIDSRIAAVVAEMGRAKTLWPVALRSLEARLDDLVSRPHVRDPDESEAPEPEPAEVSDHLLAGLRAGLHAMEDVAEEMTRASEAWGSEGDTPVQETHEAAAGGARILPLRASEP